MNSKTNTQLFLSILAAEVLVYIYLVFQLHTPGLFLTIIPALVSLLLVFTPTPFKHLFYSQSQDQPRIRADRNLLYLWALVHLGRLQIDAVFWLLFGNYYAYYTGLVLCVILFPTLMTISVLLAIRSTKQANLTR